MQGMPNIPAAQMQRPPEPTQAFNSRQGLPPSSAGPPLQSLPVGAGVAQGNPRPGNQYPAQQHERSFSQPPVIQPTYNNNMGMMARNGPNHTYNSASITSTGPPQLSTLPFQNSAPLSTSFSPVSNHSPQAPVLMKSANLPPLKPVFGLTLEQLFERDGSAVPMVVYQCIQAVDLYGLEVEGIYRLSGTNSHVNKIKAMFDNGKQSRITCM
jgi:Rho GTPase-activating protein RGD1